MIGIGFQRNSPLGQLHTRPRVLGKAYKIRDYRIMAIISIVG